MTSTFDKKGAKTNQLFWGAQLKAVVSAQPIPAAQLSITKVQEGPNCFDWLPCWMLCFSYFRRMLIVY